MQLVVLALIVVLQAPETRTITGKVRVSESRAGIKMISLAPTSGPIYNLKFESHPDLWTQAMKLDGHQAVVTGVFSEIKGTAIEGQRVHILILDVTQIGKLPENQNISLDFWQQVHYNKLVRKQ